MIKKFDEYVNEDLRSKNIVFEPQYDNLQKLYPNIGVNYNDDYKIVISYDGPLELNEEFYKILEKDNIKIEDIIFENCRKISLYDINNFKKISDYGKFGEGIIDFSCSFCNNLQSLNGCPEKVGKDFSCSRCINLQSLECAPKNVGGYFNCSGCNNLQSLEGCPETVIDFYCYGCINLQSLNGCQKEVCGNFSCSFCDKLQSLNGAPETVNGYFDCSDCNNLQSLNGAPEKISGDFYCKSCNLDFIELAKQKYGDKVKYK